MFKSQRFYFSFQLGIRYDYLLMHYQNTHYQIDFSDTYYLNTEQNEAGSPGNWYAQLTNTFALGVYFPKRNNSLIQIHPMAIATYNISSAHTQWDRPLIKTEYYYYLNQKWYDYSDRYGFALRAYSVNARIWRILAGINGGADTFFSEMMYMYLGYQAPVFTLTAGLYNGESFSTSLQLRF